MDIQRVNPGQAGATGIPVRVSRTNEEVILNAQGDALSRRARSVGQMQKALSGLGTAAEAVGKAGAAIYMYDAALNEAKAGHEQKLATANFNTDMQLTNALFGRKLDALAATARKHYDQNDEGFVKAIESDIDGAVAATINEAVSPNGAIKFRNADFFRVRIAAELRNGLGAKFMSDQWKSRKAYETNTAIGKIEAVLDGVANGGRTNREEYKDMGTVYGLYEYLTPDEAEKTIDLFLKKGATVAFSTENTAFLDEAAKKFEGVFKDKIEGGDDFDVAKKKAFKEAKKLYEERAVSLPGKGILDEAFVDAEKEKSMLALAKLADNVKRASNEARYQNLCDSVIGGGQPTAENFRLVSLLTKQIESNSDSSKEASWLIGELGGEFSGVVLLANELKNDIALLNLKDSKDAKLLEEYLTVARSLGDKEFYEIKTLVQDKIALGGKKSAEKDEIRDFVSGVFRKALNKLRGDEAEDALACIDACTGIPRNQWRVVVDATLDNANVRRANRDGKSNLYKLLTGSAGSKLTVMNMLGEYRKNEDAMKAVETALNKSEEQGE